MIQRDRKSFSRASFVALAKRNAVLLAGLILILLPSGHSLASDHADPLFLRNLEAGITDLFAFENEESLVVIVCVRRALADGGQLSFEPYHFEILLDLDSRVRFDDEDTLARYGGKVINPDGISADIKLEFKLVDRPKPNPEKWAESLIEGRLRTTLIDNWKIEVPSSPDGIRIWSGVVDDPFIFHRFNRTNCVATVVEIPWTHFPETQKDFLIWATSHRFGEQVDHVGRSLRTMLPRFEVLNTLHPSVHVRTLRQRHEAPGLITDIPAVLISPLFGLRHYDFEPDVMILTRRKDLRLGGKPYRSSYPNGRRLEDDVAELCCQQGDCLLFEVSLADAHADGQERPDEHPRPFNAEFPYLLDPIVETDPFEEPQLKARNVLLLVIIGIVLLGVILLPWWLFLRARRRLLRLLSGRRFETGQR